MKILDCFCYFLHQFLQLILRSHFPIDRHAERNHPISTRFRNHVPSLTSIPPYRFAHQPNGTFLIPDGYLFSIRLCIRFRREATTIFFQVMTISLKKEEKNTHIPTYKHTHKHIIFFKYAYYIFSFSMT